MSELLSVAEKSTPREGVLIDTSNDPRTVTMRGGVVVSCDVLQRLWTIEARGASFDMTKGGFVVTPPTSLTSEDKQFLIVHFDEALKILEYVEKHALVCL